jgi:hypothetical protein
MIGDAVLRGAERSCHQMNHQLERGCEKESLAPKSQRDITSILLANVPLIAIK